MIKFKNARIVGSDKLVSVEELDKVSKDAPIMQKLLCPDCSCKLGFIHTGERVAHLYTRGIHDESCEYKVKQRGAKIIVKYSDDVLISINSTGQRNRSKRASYEFLRKYKDEHNIPITKRKHKAKGSVSKVKNDKSKRELRKRATPTLKNNHTIVNAGRVAHIPTVFPTGNIVGKTNRPVKTAGILKKITIFPRQVVIEIVDGNAAELLVMNEAFFSKSSVDFRNTMISLSKIVEQDTDNELIIVSAVADVVPSSIKGVKTESLIRDESSFLINSKDPGMFVTKWNNKE